MEQLAGAPGIAGGKVVGCALDAASWILGAQTDCQLEQLGGCGRRSSGAGDLGRSIERLDGRRFASGIRERQMASAQFGFDDQLS